MWFKNIRFLQFQDKLSYNIQQLSKQLEPLAFKPCPKSLPQSYGWVPPVGDGQEEHLLVFGQSPFMLIRLRIEEKVLPPAVVREKLAEEIVAIEKKTGRRVYKDEKERLKDEVYQSLLSKAFSKSSYVNAYLDTEKNWLVVDCPSDKKLASFVSLLNKCVDNPIGGFDLGSSSKIMTSWLLNNDYPSSFSLAKACVMQAPEQDGCTARIKNEDLLSDKVQTFLKEGSQVTQLALVWSEQIYFTLRADFTFASVRFLEAVRELARDGLSESKEERFAADFVIMAQTLQQFFAELLDFHKRNYETVDEAVELAEI